MKLNEKLVFDEEKYKGNLLNVRKLTVKLPNGCLATREIVKHADAVAILPVTSDNKIILEKQWRSPINDVIVEIPAGKIDERDENPREAALRELNEEIGYESQNLQKICSFYTSPGFTDEYMTLYFAKNLVKVDNKLPKDFGENIELFECSIKEALKMIEQGNIKDGKTITAVYYFELLEKEK